MARLLRWASLRLALCASQLKNSKSDGSESREENLSKKDLALQQALDRITASFGNRSNAPREVPVVSTGSFDLDMALRIGGLPKGCIVEIYGPEVQEKLHLPFMLLQNLKKMEEDGQTLVSRLIDRMMKSDRYEERRGVAFGLVGVAKGFGISRLKHYGIITALHEGLQDRNSAKSREGASLGFEWLYEKLLFGTRQV